MIFKYGYNYCEDYKSGWDLSVFEYEYGYNYFEVDIEMNGEEFNFTIVANPYTEENSATRCDNTPENLEYTIDDIIFDVTIVNGKITNYYLIKHNGTLSFGGENITFVWKQH